MNKYFRKIAIVGLERSRQKQQDWMESKEGLSKSLVEYKDYTPARIEKAREMFDAGLLSSYPEELGTGITWFRDADQGVTHRSGNLPAYASRNGDELEWVVEGKPHRGNGPAVIDRQAGSPNIRWFNEGEYIGETRIAHHTTGRVVICRVANRGEVSPQEYEKKIKSTFPNVGDNIYLWDWIKIPEEFVGKEKILHF